MTATESAAGHHPAQIAGKEMRPNREALSSHTMELVRDPITRARIESWARATQDIRRLCAHAMFYLPTDPALVFDLESVDPDVHDAAYEAAEEAGGERYAIIYRDLDWGSGSTVPSRIVHRGWVGNPEAVSADGRTWHFAGRTLDVIDAAEFLLGLPDRESALAELLKQFGSEDGRVLYGNTPDGEECSEFVTWDRAAPADWGETASEACPKHRGCDQRKRLVPVNARLWVDVQLPPPDPILAGCWDAGCKAVVVGDSKARKSFFALQLAVQLASGRGPFLRWSLPKARSVLLVQPEIPAGHFQARLRAMLRGLGLRADALADRLHILNLRGVGFTDDVWDEMEGTALGVHAESLIMDPFYKLLHDGDENLARDVRPILRRLDGLCENTGAGALTVLHTPKGTAGDRKAIDRSAGSGIVARDFDAGLYLGEHAQGDGALVVESVLRAYPPCDAFSIRFDCDAGIFRIADDLAPVARTSRTRTARGPDAASCHAALLGLLASGPLPVRAFDERARERLGVGEKRFRELRAGLLEEGRLATSPREGRPHGRLFIGTPEQIRELVSGWANTNPDCFGGRM